MLPRRPPDWYTREHERRERKHAPPSPLGRYYFRRKVPADLVEVLGKREVKVALGTADPKAARELVRIESLKVDQEFAEARRKIGAGAGAGQTELTRARLELSRRSATDSILGKLRANLENDPLWPHRWVETGALDQATGEAIAESDLDSTLDLIAEPWVDVARGYAGWRPTERLPNCWIGITYRPRRTLAT